MVYDTLSDMIIDNRNSLVKEIEHLSAEDKENVLAAFDWLAVEHIKEYIANSMIIEKLKERYTEDEFRAMDAEVGRNFRLLLVAEQKYYTDVKTGRKVGYSAEDEVISGE